MRVIKQKWSEARLEILQHQPEMAEIIDAINPTDNYQFYRVRYYFGDRIVKDGSLCVPIDDTIFPIDSERAKQEFGEELSYSPIPVSLLLSRGAEVYAEPNQRIAPLAVLQPGSLFGIWETLDPTDNVFVSCTWSVSAGARTLFFLPKIAEKNSHKKLIEAYRIKVSMQNNIYQQWELFRELLAAANDNSWYCDVIFFSSAWFKQQGDGKAWDAFRFFMMDMAWQQTKRWRSKEYAEIMWETFLSTLAKDNIKSSQNELFLARHLIDIAYGIYPGFQPVMDEVLVPTKKLQEIYLEDYKLSQYAPILFAPFHGSVNDAGGKPIYLSLSYPTNINYTINEKRQKNAISTLRHLINLQNTIQLHIEMEKLPVFESINAIQYDYFHSQEDPPYGIRGTSKLVDFDPNFKQIMEQFPDREFPDYSTVLRGCIAMTEKN